MSDLVKWYNDERTKSEMSPIELAAVFHYRYIRIHPFEDGNGRICPSVGELHFDALPLSDDCGEK